MMALNHTHRIVILVFSISLTVLANENPQLYVPCKPGWYLFGEKCYKLISPTGLFKRYQFACRLHRGHLASIHSDELQEFLTVFMLLNLRTEAWIGLKNKGTRTSMEFVWEDGSIYNYTNWDRNQPSYDFEHNKVDCVQMGYHHAIDGIGKWSILQCNSYHNYMCQVNKNNTENSPDPRFCSLEEGLGWKFQNSCYHIVEEEKSWEDAEKYCEERYEGYLVNILDYDTEIFLNYIQRLSNLSENVWIGINMRNNSVQKWASGWHVASKKMNEKKLNFVNGTCALKLHQNAWVAAPCLNKYPFICEKIKYNVPILKRPPSEDWKCPNSSREWLDLEGESCYYIETQTLRNWSEASQDCKKIGGTLAIFHSEDETNILRPHVTDTQKRLFIGLKRSSPENGVFEWADGTEVAYKNWNLEQLNNYEGCADLWTKSMKWNVVSCNTSEGYICKSEKVFSETDEISTLVPDICAEDQTYSGGIPAGTVVGIIFCTLLIILLACIVVYHTENFWKSYCTKTENDELTFTSSSAVF